MKHKKRKVFFTVGITLFVVGMLYINANYEISYHPEGGQAVSLESRSIGNSDQASADALDAALKDGGFRIGNFVIAPKK